MESSGSFFAAETQLKLVDIDSSKNNFSNRLKCNLISLEQKGAPSMLDSLKAFLRFSLLVLLASFVIIGCAQPDAGGGASDAADEAEEAVAEAPAEEAVAEPAAEETMAEEESADDAAEGMEEAAGDMEEAAEGAEADAEGMEGDEAMADEEADMGEEPAAEGEAEAAEESAE